MLIDVTRLVGRAVHGRQATGVDRVCAAYVEHFGSRAQAVLQWGEWRRIASYRTSQQLFDVLLARPADAPARLRKVVARGCVPPWPRQDGRNRLSLNIGHQGLDRPGLVRWMRRTAQRPLFFAHDLIPITHPEYCRPGEQALHAARMHNLLDGATGVVANSAATLASMRQFAERAGTRLPPAIAAPIAGAQLAGEAATSPLARPYFVVLGTIEPRKNHQLLLHAWRELVQRMGSAAPQLVVIGQRGWECENAEDLLERCEALRGHVLEVGSCSDTELARYLRHARALLFPSFAEGYGLPLVEALALGTPVIASDLAVFREVAGAIPEYLHPLDGPGWVQAVRDYSDDTTPRRAAQCGRLAGFRAPTWRDHFEQVEAFMEALQ
nr:glycosyltransferase family 1 protein [Ramlibacter cellulosilyticus]